MISAPSFRFWLVLLPFCLWTTASPGQAAKPTFTTLYTFTGSSVGDDGADPIGTLAVDANGVLYGVTAVGGINNEACSTGGCGTVFSVVPPTSRGGAWQESVLWKFGGYTGDGNGPVGGVVLGAGGVLYGATGAGGAGFGTVYSLTPPALPGGAWTETIVWNFNGGSLDGSYPTGVVLGAGGVLYGATGAGGAGFGTVYSLTPPASPGGAWTESLWRFNGGTADGATPQFPLALGPDATLYGTTDGGGINNRGVVFSIIPPASTGDSGTENILVSLGARSNGASGPITISPSPSGVLYGVTKAGPFSWGTVFSLTPPASPRGAWKKHVLFTFPAKGPEKLKYGGEPNGPLVELLDGSLLGITQIGGQGSGGTLYRLKPPAMAGEAWGISVMESLSTFHAGASQGGLVKGTGKVIYGVSGGGTSGDGIVFSFVP